MQLDLLIENQCMSSGITCKSFMKMLPSRDGHRLEILKLKRRVVSYLLQLDLANTCTLYGEKKCFFTMQLNTI